MFAISVPLGPRLHREPQLDMLRLRCSVPHPVGDKGIKETSETRDEDLLPLPDLCLSTCGIQSCRGHDGLLTNSRRQMCQ